MLTCLSDSVESLMDVTDCSDFEVSACIFIEFYLMKWPPPIKKNTQPNHHTPTHKLQSTVLTMEQNLWWQERSKAHFTIFSSFHNIFSLQKTEFHFNLWWNTSEFFILFAEKMGEEMAEQQTVLSLVHTCLTSCWNSLSPSLWWSLTLPRCHNCSSCRWCANTWMETARPKILHGKVNTAFIIWEGNYYWGQKLLFWKKIVTWVILPRDLYHKTTCLESPHITGKAYTSI